MGSKKIRLYARSCMGRKEHSNAFLIVKYFCCSNWSYSVLHFTETHLLLWHNKLLTICLTEWGSTCRKSCLLLKLLLTDLEVLLHLSLFAFFSGEWFYTSHCRESCMFIDLQWLSDPDHLVYREICFDCHLANSKSQVCGF